MFRIKKVEYDGDYAVATVLITAKQWFFAKGAFKATFVWKASWVLDRIDNLSVRAWRPEE